MKFWWMPAAALLLAACGGSGEEAAQPDTGASGGETRTLLQLPALSGGKGSTTLHRITVPQGALALSVTTTGGSGNVDIAVLAPGGGICESGGAGNDERCDIPRPAGGEWQTGLHGADAYSGVTLIVLLTVPAESPPSTPPPAEPPATPPAQPEPPAAPPATPPVTPPANGGNDGGTGGTPGGGGGGDPGNGGNTGGPGNGNGGNNGGGQGDGNGNGNTPPPSAISLLNSDAHQPRAYARAGSRVFFISSAVPSPSQKLWMTDGTVGGTRALDSAHRPSSLLAVGDAAVFAARDPDSRLHGLWRVNAAGEVSLVRTILNSIGSGNDGATLIGEFGGRAYFIGDDGLRGRELWSTDGTRQGTHLVGDIALTGDARLEARDAWTWWNGRLYFFAAGNGRNASPQLYSTNGQPGGLVQLTSSDPAPGSLNGYDMVVFRDRLYFTWHSREDGVELWSTDGTPGGTARFFDSLPGRERSGSPRKFNVISNRLVFAAFYAGSTSQRGLFASDGTAPGTSRISSVDMPDVTRRMVALKGRYYFPGRQADRGPWELWATDGTSAGTVRVSATVQPAPERFLPEERAGTAVLGDRLLFLGRDGAGHEPWVTDGTAAGTTRVADIHPGGGSSFDPRSESGWLATRGGKAYFTAAVAPADFRFFETDGTAAGTREVVPTDATVLSNTRGQGNDPLAEPFSFGERLLFGARYYTEGPAVLFGM